MKVVGIRELDTVRDWYWHVEECLYESQKSSLHEDRILLLKKCEKELEDLQEVLHQIVVQDNILGFMSLREQIDTKLAFVKSKL